jgi:tRNA G18 (ribose-2'-O)-methylase SpoU
MIPAMIVLLDNIRSTQNVGSIFRTANGAGVSTIYCCGITPTPTNRLGVLRSQFEKTALGAEKDLQWNHCPDTLTCIQQLRAQGTYIIALEQDKQSIPYYTYTPPHDNIALIVGNEVEGISKKILKQMDDVIEIPMHGTKESLNVAVAFGIAIFSLLS